MFDGGISLRSENRKGSTCRRVITGDSDVWVLVARPGDDVGALLRSGRDVRADEPLWICSAVLGDGVVVIRSGEESDPFLSAFVGQEEGETA